MGLQFYRKPTPRTHVVIQGNLAIEFKTVDGLYGFYKTDNPVIQAEFQRLQNEQRYAIEDITEAQYNELYEQKKTQSPLSRTPWREEFGSANRAARQDSPVVAAQNSAPTVATPTAIPPSAPPTPAVQEFTPAVGKRKPGKPPNPK